MKTIKGLLFDIGGVLYTGERAIEGAPKTIAMLEQHYPMRFLTNTTRTTPQTIHSKLQKMGFTIDPKMLFTALDATKNYITDQKGTVYTLLTDEAQHYFEDLKSDKPNFVVVGDAHLNFTYEKLNNAFRALMEGAQLIAAAKNHYFQDTDHKLSLDAGGFITALEFATNTQARLIGKPSAEFFHMAVASIGLKPDEVLMIGDDIESDIKGAMDAGLRAALVKTGKFQPEDMHKKIEPDVVLPDVTALPSLLM